MPDERDADRREAPDNIALRIANEHTDGDSVIGDHPLWLNRDGLVEAVIAAITAERSALSTLKEENERLTMDIGAAERRGMERASDLVDNLPDDSDLGYAVLSIRTEASRTFGGEYQSALADAEARVAILTETVGRLRGVLTGACEQILDSYRTWVADDTDAHPRPGQIPRYDAARAALSTEPTKETTSG